MTALTGYVLAGPCDTYKNGGTPCVAAHSTVRALYSNYSGKLYQVRRAKDNTTKDIMTLTPGGAADAASQDAFCQGTSCVVTIVYDQSGNGNNLEYQGSGSSVGGRDQPASATTESFNLGGQKVYSLYIKPGNSYWRDGHTTGVPTKNAPEGVYMVTSGTHYNSGCCFDYGNSETDRKADGAGAMDAIYFGNSCWFKDNSNYKCNTGAGPWVQADLEYGLFAWNSASTWNPKEVSFTSKYVTAMLKNNGTTKYAMKGANAAQTGNLTTIWDGSLPPGYNPMKKQGAIVLGSGGDCCATNTNMSEGTFYEGAIVNGYPTDATDSLVHKDILAAGYGSNYSSVEHGTIHPARALLHYDPTESRVVFDGALEQRHVTVKAVDFQGKQIAQIFDGVVLAGKHEASWDARNIRDGIFILKFSIEGQEDMSMRVVSVK
ncbi:MAG: arabinofuranosidase catalytic domain-containing protein [Bacillota bacterium]|nr:arabinofuranosidase catalytic domain-containing protein [Bacillota bacterium]